ncbi:MAG: Redoxin domain protein [Edaphobacter sp.]|nr:Redoxin domain protein [Edaphobacter sp.]
MRSGIIRSGAIVCLLLSSAFEMSAEPLTAGHVAPPFVLKRADGKAVSLASHKGQVVLLNFWATWCAPCRVEMPWFEEFSKTYGNRGLYVLGVSLDDGGWKAVQPVISKLKVSYPIVLGDGKITKSYGMGDLLPATFLIDRTGKIRTVKIGFGDKLEFEKTIEQLLDGK